MFFPSFSFWRSKAAPAIATSVAVYNNITTIGDLYIGNRVLRYDIPNNRSLPITRNAVLAGLDPQHLTFPGPIINVMKGETLTINVHNDIEDKSMEVETSIHWHGIEQRHRNWADGVAHVTQCPIAQTKSFQYKFPIQFQAGTFWYHSHFGLQYCDGLRGALIVRDPTDPKRFNYSPEDDNDNTVITLADWFRGRSTSSPGQPDLTLINGESNHFFEVRKNKRYRFRLISTACTVPWEFSIDEHVMTVIEVEGVLIQPYDVTQIPIHPGQRYSFILDTRDKDDTRNYQIRVTVPSGNNGQPLKNGFPADATLHYNNAPKNGTTNSSDWNPHNILDESKIRSLFQDPYLNQDVVRQSVALGQLPNGGGFTLGNGTRYRPPKTPVLLQILGGVVDPFKLLPPGSVFGVERNKTIEVTFTNADNTGGGPHPMHLHGHTFSVIRSIGQYGPGAINLEHPPRRDTVATSLFKPVNGTPSEVIFRFRTDNPGPWILHCHIDLHLETGMALVFAEATNETRAWQEELPEDEIQQVCIDYWGANPGSGP